MRLELLLLVSICGPAAFAQQALQSYDFQDGDFPGDYSTQTFISGNGGTARVTRQPSGGNPGNFLQFDFLVNSGSQSTPATVASVWINTEARYQTFATGPIAFLSYSEDAKVLGMAAGQFTGLALRQGGRIYVLTNFMAITSGPSWTHLTKDNITSTDFAELTPSNWLDNSSRPNFTSLGSPIEFGFWRASLSMGGGQRCDMYGCVGSDGSVTTSMGLDNWHVSVFPAQLITTEGDSPNAGATDDPVSTATGEYYEEATELSLGGPLPLRLTRYYAAFLKASGFSGALGSNWMHNFDANLVSSSTDTVVTLFRGARVHFTRTGSTWQLQAPTRLPYQLTSDTNGFRFLDPAANLIFSFTPGGALSSIEDRSGNALTVTRSFASPGPDSVADGLGRSLAFSYSGGKLMRVEDQTGRAIVFSYSGNDMVTATDVNGKTSRYSYSQTASPGTLESKSLPTGSTPLTQTVDAKGRVIRQTDGRGFSTTLSYDTPKAGTTTLTNPLSASTQHAYQSSVNLLGSVDPSGQTSSYAYDNANRLVGAVDRLGAKTAVAYDSASGLPSAITDELGNTTRYSYSSQIQAGFTFYNLTRAAYSDGSSSVFTFDSQGRVLDATDQAGRVTHYTYNSRGQTLTISNPSGGVSRFSYGNDGTLASSTMPSGDVTHFDYDRQKRLVTITFPDQSTRTLAYDSAGNIIQQTNERGRADTFDYDDNGQIRSAANSQSGTATITYNADVKPASYAAPGAKTVAFDFDPAGRLKSIPTPSGDIVNLGFNEEGRLTSLAWCSGKGLQFGYDKEGRINSLGDGLGRTWSLTADPAGNITSITSPLARTFAYAYDRLGRLVKFTDALSRTTNFGRDTRGRLTSLASPGGLNAVLSLNELGLPTALTDPNGNNWSQSYDAQGRLTTRLDPLGRVITHQFDSRGRLIQSGFQEGSLQIGYDPSGNIISRSYSDGTTSIFVHDDNHRVVQADHLSLLYDARSNVINSNGLANTYDDGFKISSVTYAPGKTLTYQYDCNGLLTTIVDWSGATTQFVYDDARELTAIVRPNGVNTQYSYDNDGRLIGIVEARVDTLASISLTRDAAGNITSADRKAPQLPNPGPSVAQFAYDAAGQAIDGSYDSLGRPQALGFRTYLWDLAGHLTGYSGPDGSATLAYDGLGSQVSRVSGAVSQNYLTNYGFRRPVISTLQQDGADLRYFVYLPEGTLLYSIEAADSSRHFYHFDEVGSTTFLTGDDGSITNSYAITPYGEQVDHTGTSDNPFTFLGAWGVTQEGATGLYLMGARYYDSAAGRFLARQPVTDVSLKSANPYQYAHSNPLSFIDPRGRGSQAGRQMNLAEGGDFAQWVLSAPEMFPAGKRSRGDQLVPSLFRALLLFEKGMELRKETKP